MRAYGNRAPVVLVRVTPHQGRREGRLQREAAQGYGIAGGRARDVRILNWRNTGSGEPHDTETVLCGSGRGRWNRASNGTSPAAYFMILGPMVLPLEGVLASRVLLKSRVFTMLRRGG